MKIAISFAVAIIAFVASLWFKLGFLTAISLTTATFGCLFAFWLLTEPTLHCYYCGKRTRKSKAKIERGEFHDKWICPRCSRAYFLHE